MRAASGHGAVKWERRRGSQCSPVHHDTGGSPTGCAPVNARHSASSRLQRHRRQQVAKFLSVGQGGFERQLTVVVF